MAEEQPAKVLTC